MRMFDNLRLAVKLPIILGTLMLLSLMSMGYTGYVLSRDALMAAGEARVTSEIDAKLQEFDTWFSTLSADLKSQAANPLTIRALHDFSEAWQRLGADAPGYVRQRFINANPYGPNERYKMTQAADVSDYSIAHARYQSGFVSMLQEKGYHDVLLIDEGGTILYSAAKEDDFGQNIFTGPLRSTRLAQVARRVIEAPDASVLFSDFSPYPPSQDQSAGFAAAPIRDQFGRVGGALVYQLSVDQLDAILNRGREGGSQVLAYLVGHDHMLRSNVKAADAGDALRQRAQSEAVRRAFATTHALTHEPGLFGVPSVLVTGHIDAPGMQLALIYEQSDAELIKPAYALSRRLAAGGAIAIGVLSLLAFLLARNLSRPLVRTAEAMRTIAAGDYAPHAVNLDRRDEVGTITRALETMRVGLAAGAAAARDGAFKSAAFVGSSAAMMTMDRDYRITYVNPAMATILRRHEAEFRAISADFDADQATGRGPEFFARNPARLIAALEDPGALPYCAEIAVGASRFALDINEVAMPEQGRIGFVLEWRDVTVERMNRAVLIAIDRNLATAEFDADGRCVKANRKMCETLHRDEAGVVGLCKDDLVRFDATLAAERGRVWDRLMAGESVFDRFWMRAAADREAVIEGGFSPVHDRDGNLLSVLLMGSDVTDAQLGLRHAEERRQSMERAQTQVVDALRVGLSELSGGNLAVRIDDRFADDYETLRADFNAAVRHLAQAVTTVISNAVSINEEVRDIAQASDDLSMRTERQAATLEETAAALDQLTASVQSAATGASDANLVVSAARASAEASGPVVSEAVSAMSEIERSSEKIARIIGVIDDISFQTNLLALNAGVEAARAGDAGRGFAVVATEVRALAQRSSEAAREIDTLISEANLQVKRGVGLVGQTGLALKDIVGSVNHIAQRMADIAVSAQEQSASLAEINLAVNQIDHVTQQNTALFGETAVASQRLKVAAETLTATVAGFRVDAEGAANQPEKADPRRRAGGAQVATWPLPRVSAEPAPRRPATRAGQALAEDWDVF